MKLNGFVGKGSGKFGSSVFAISGGKQIVRQYNPSPANPSTEAQVGQRAKLKLLSQLSGQLASVIAIPKQGLVSARNRFVSVNYPQTTWDEDEAQLLAENIKLTASARAMSNISVTASGNAIHVALTNADDYALYDKVCFVSLNVNAGGVQVVQVKLSDNTSGEDMDKGDDECVVLAYGIIDSEGAAKGVYEDITAADSTAKIVTSRLTASNGAVVTDTIGKKLGGIA